MHKIFSLFGMEVALKEMVPDGMSNITVVVLRH